MSLDCIDLYPRQIGEDGSIRNDYANEDLHLMSVGYAQWHFFFETTG